MVFPANERRNGFLGLGLHTQNRGAKADLAAHLPPL